MERPIRIIFRPNKNNTITFEMIEGLAKITSSDLDTEVKTRLEELYAEYDRNKHKNHNKSIEILMNIEKEKEKLLPIGYGYDFDICKMPEYLGWFMMYLEYQESDNRVNKLINLIKDICKDIELKVVVMRD